MQTLIRELLAKLGEDPEREGLLHTPARVTDTFEFLTQGYGQDAGEAIGRGVFDANGCDEMIVVKDIEIYSLCEHHLVPFFGKAHVAYIPEDHIVGLSKIARVVDIYARRLQVQERLTTEIATALEDALHPKGVGVVIEAAHLCMMMRGVQKQNSKTVTSCLRGSFRRDERTRAEFLNLVHG